MYTMDLGVGHEPRDRFLGEMAALNPSPRLIDMEYGVLPSRTQGVDNLK